MSDDNALTGAYNQVALGKETTFLQPAEADKIIEFPYGAEGFSVTPEFNKNKGTNGSLDLDETRVVVTKLDAGFSGAADLSEEIWDFMMEAAGLKPLADDPPSYTGYQERRTDGGAADLEQYPGLKFYEAELSASEGGVIQIALSGKCGPQNLTSGTIALNPMTSGASAVAVDAPFLMVHCALTIDTVAVDITSVRIKNALGIAEQFANSLTRLHHKPSDRTISGEFIVNWTAANMHGGAGLGLLSKWLNATSAAIVLTVNDGTNSHTATIPAVKFEGKLPSALTKEFMTAPLQFTAVKTAGAPIITVT